MTRTGRLRVVLGLNLVLIAALVTVGVSAHSLGVLAAGADYLADAAAICVSLFAIRVSRRHLASGKPTTSKATTVAALVNAGWLLVLCLLVIADAILRLTMGAGQVDGLPVLIVSGVAALLMLVGAIILGGDDDDPDDVGGSLNMQAVLLDTAADSAAAAGVAATGGIVLVTRGSYWLDPTVALVIAAIVAYHASKLLRKVVAGLRTAGAIP